MILEIHVRCAGAGVLEQDWGSMPLRSVYARLKHGYRGNSGSSNEMGISLRINGNLVNWGIECVYGYLRPERRIVSFEFLHLRGWETSYIILRCSLVDVARKMDGDIDTLSINPDDLKIDARRWCRWQHIKEDCPSVVRITHIPTGIVMQSQRNVLNLKAETKLMKMLKAKLFN